MRIQIKSIPVVSAMVMSFLAVSCDDILDVEPKDRLTADNYFKTEDQLQLYSDRFYTDNLPGAYSIYADNADMLIISPLDDKVSGQRVVPQTGGGWEWSNLRHINYFLENIDKCEDEDARLKYEALARFFRAYFYFEKVKDFGDVPWYDKVLGSDDQDLYKARDSREFVMNKAMEDVNFAITTFEKNNKDKDAYRVTYWTALALKSRMGLFEGTFRKYHGQEGYERYLNDCVEASQLIIDGGEYKLYTSGSTPYRSLFTSKNANTDEIILARDFNSEFTIEYNIKEFEASPSTGRPGLSKKLVNYYLKDDGTRFTDEAGYDEKEFKDEVVGRDPRLAQTIRTGLPDEKIKMNGTMTGYQLLKYASGTLDQIQSQDNDLPVFRLAEVYLNFAEAKAELGTLTQDDLNNSVNKLRQRVHMPDMNLEAANTNSDPYLSSPTTGYVNVSGDNKGIILEIRRERGIELIMEGFRYDDLMRWKEGQCIAQPMEGIYIPENVINTAYDIDGDGTPDVCFYTGDSEPDLDLDEGVEISYVQISEDANNVTTLTNGTYGNLRLYNNIDRTWNEERDYLYPIPRQEVILTNGVVTQNPGWEE